jgi:hypothetical protein
MPEKVTKQAHYVEVGDVLDLGSYVSKVTGVQPYVLAYPDDRTVRTSNPDEDHRWQVLHIQTEDGGVVRFLHEKVIVVA